MVARRRLAKEGRTLGNPNGAASLRRAGKGNTAALARIADQTDARAENYRDTIADVDPAGAMSLRAVTTELNHREIEAPRGGLWYPTSVAGLMARLTQGDFLWLPIGPRGAPVDAMRNARKRRLKAKVRKAKARAIKAKDAARPNQR